MSSTSKGHHRAEGHCGTTNTALTLSSFNFWITLGSRGVGGNRYVRGSQVLLRAFLAMARGS